MASVTAAQGYLRGPLAEVRRVLMEEEGEDALRGKEDAYRTENAAVYSVAHHAFAYLLVRFGDAGVKRLLAAMDQGEEFDAAFEEALGLQRQDFEREFREYVVSQAWLKR